MITLVIRNNTKSTQKLSKVIRILAIVLAAACCGSAWCADKIKVEKPDFEKIKAATTNEDSKYYYPKLLKAFMSNDTIMNNEDFKYFYYGALFQEDYDPYRSQVDEEELKRLEPLYNKAQHTRAERDDILKYAQRALADNPLDIIQLKNLIFVYEQNKKVNLAKIWKNKLNHILRVIASSGTGTEADNAWTVVYPRQEFDFLNLSGLTVLSREFAPPYYEKVSVNPKREKDPKEYYFNLQPVLEQYYHKHPSEAE